MNVVLTIGLLVPDESLAADLFREAVRLRQPEGISPGDVLDIIEDRTTDGVEVQEVEITD